ncbi:MAG: hypothetical protein JWP44_2636 [Mucilaginibacter sp.]|nr:hypothetical protein [Mucilaginibacter sp.]
MAAITLKNVPQELHRTLKILKMDLEDQGVKKTLEEVYLEMVTLGLKQYQTKKAAK